MKITTTTTEKNCEIKDLSHSRINRQDYYVQYKTSATIIKKFFKEKRKLNLYDSNGRDRMNYYCCCCCCFGLINFLFSCYHWVDFSKSSSSFVSLEYELQQQ